MLPLESDSPQRPLERINAEYKRVIDLAAKNEHTIEKSVQFQSMPKLSGFVELKLHGHEFLMFVSRNDDGVALKLLWNHTYECLSTQIWCNLARQSKAIVDVGAHTGIYSILAARSNPKAMIAAMEPTPLNFARLVMNLRENDIENVACMRVAVSDKRGWEKFGANTQQWYLSTGGKLNHLGALEPHIVQTVVLDDLPGIDLIKLDTEGHELRCLQGMPKTLEGRPTILFECTENGAEIFAFLHKLGYRISSINDKNQTVTPVNAPVTGKNIWNLNYLATYGT